MDELVITKDLVMKFGLCLMIAYGGMVGHFMKKKIKGETFSAFTKYFRGHFKSTLSALAVTTIGVLIAFDSSMSLRTLVVTCIGIGYSCDSGINNDGGIQ